MPSFLHLVERGDFRRLAALVRERRIAEARPGRDDAASRLIESVCWMCSEEGDEAARHQAALVELERRRREWSSWLATAVRALEGDSRAPPPTPHAAPAPAAPARPTRALPTIAVHCLGTFHVFVGDREVAGWSNGRSKAVFKLLVMHEARSVPKDVLMEAFWPNADPDAARNRLNVAVYGVRKAFAPLIRSPSVVLFRDDSYLLNPALSLWIDYREFLHHVSAARRFDQDDDAPSAVHEYHSAEALYRGDFLEEDRYEDWPQALRTSLRDEYLAVLDRLADHYYCRDDYGECVNLCTRLLTLDPCHERAHRRVMRCWSREGLPHLALRQYDTCRRALLENIGAPPATETADLAERVRARDPV